LRYRLEVLVAGQAVRVVVVGEIVEIVAGMADTVARMLGIAVVELLAVAKLLTDMVDFVARAVGMSE
jgi:hypothetical protein